MALKSRLNPGSLDFLSAWVAVNLFLWNTKNFVDDYRAFDGVGDRGFSLGFTVFFSGISYTLLALAAASLGSGLVAASILTMYFVCLSLWSFCSYFRRSRIQVPDLSEVDRRERRLRWIFQYLYAGTLCFLAANLSPSVGAVVPAIFLLAIYGVDVMDSRTFETDQIKAA
ncbi:hypothetical protein [Sphingobium sp. RAC03]|uniref:hypothetical protein n=1 Tax=Sphingobium sp. RAC03 TaxID=1843368 RepID=UPI0014960A23|nr:hypothetical protein [Sphingobium sp. RAC03]